jgi:hypothetical protein
MPMVERPQIEWFQRQALECIGLALRANDPRVKGGQCERGADDRRIAGRPVESAPGKEAHGFTFPAHLKPIAVVLDLVNLVGPEGTLKARVGMQRGTKPVARRIPLFYRRD